MMQREIDHLLQEKRLLSESPFPQMSRDYSARFAGSPYGRSPLRSFHDFLHTWFSQVARGLRVGHREIQSSAFSGIGRAEYHGTYMDLPVYYSDGQVKVIRVSLTENGFVVQHVGTKDRPMEVPFDDPKKAINILSRKLWVGGDKVRGVLKRLSGRYGMYGR